MLVTALMDIITSNCDSLDKVLLKSSLPRNAEMRDIAAAIEVIEEGGMHLDEPHGNEGDEDGGTGMKGIGIKILGGTTVFGLSRTKGLTKLEFPSSNFGSAKNSLRNLLFNKISDSSLNQANVTSVVVPGLWNDLLCQHVAVPLAAWALANWAMASNENRSHIQELDQDGHAVMTALITAERSVKLHGSLVARFLLEDHILPLNDSVPDWSFHLLSTVSQASKSEDIPSAKVALGPVIVNSCFRIYSLQTVSEKKDDNWDSSCFSTLGFSTYSYVAVGTRWKMEFDLSSEIFLTGYHTLYEWYRSVESEHFPDPTGLRARIEQWTFGLYPACIKYLMSAFDVPEVMAVTRNNICKKGMESLSQRGTVIYYASVFLDFWVFSTTIVSLVFGSYLYICINWLHLYFDEAFSSLRIANYKLVTRFHIKHDGDLEVFILGVDKVWSSPNFFLGITDSFGHAGSEGVEARSSMGWGIEADTAAEPPEEVP
ncbi:Calcineurin-like metallo-phosphoesterase superfamily protein [Actinidia rufa]|uniref:Calcineurin-like metallo-phosphoesterase superfamily protein n=1 Tax=Actinidia rufa TaxID=165716 RepID=A0A7J0EK96_9ERIC|nr:Calcineurin-like metallo-phosphoesterase superfamily protein [Actinidia rufa]